MSAKRPPGLFITGTNTSVGKTYVATAIARWLVAAGYRVGVYKPVLSGYATDREACSLQELETSRDDDVLLWKAADSPGELSRVCPQRFRAPLAPHLAARAEGREVNAEQLRSGIDYWRERSDIVLVEGAGGLLSPVTSDKYVADVAYDLGYPLVVVAKNELGVINQTLQTLVAAVTFRDGLEVAGIVLNYLSPLDLTPSLELNRGELEQRSARPLLGVLHWQASDFVPAIDWAAIASTDNADVAD